MDREYIGKSVYVEGMRSEYGLDLSEIVISTPTVEGALCLDELSWQRLVVYGVRFGYKLPEEVR